MMDAGQPLVSSFLLFFFYLNLLLGFACRGIVLDLLLRGGGGGGGCDLLGWGWGVGSVTCLCIFAETSLLNLS